MGTPNFPALAPIPFGKGVEGTPNFPALAPIPLGKGVEGTPNFPALARTNSVWEERRGNPEFPRTLHQFRPERASGDRGTRNFPRGFLGKFGVPPPPPRLLARRAPPPKTRQPRISCAH